MDKSITLNIRTLLLAGLVALAVVAAYLVGRAGPAPASAETSDSTRTITVTGVGHVAVVPDQLGFQLSVSVLRDDLDQAMNDGNTAMQAVVDSLKAAGVADKDVQTTDVSLYPEYGHQKGQPRTLRGYRVNQTVSVTVEDLSLSLIHISDPSQRPEEFRHTSVVTPHAMAVFAGFGIDGYRMALEKIASAPLPGTP